MPDDVRSPPPGYTRNEDYFDITYIYVIFGSITLFLNLPLAAYLLKTINRNQKELIVIISLSVSDSLCAAQFTGMGVYRFFVWFQDPLFISQVACNKRATVLSYVICLQLDNWFSLIIALDRLFAVSYPIRYNMNGPGYTVFLVSTPLFLAVLGYLIHLIILSSYPTTYLDDICFNNLSLLPGFRQFLSIQRILCVLIPCIIYIFIYIRMKLKFQRVSGKTSSGLSKGMRRLTNTVAYITLAAFLFVLIPEVWSYFRIFGGIDASFYFSFILIKKIVTFFIHTIRHRELMKHLEQLLPKRFRSAKMFDKASHSNFSKQKSQKTTTVN